MAKLIFSLDGNLLGEYLLDKPLLRIGRRRDNDIAIDNLMISSTHAQIMTIGQNALLQDLDSTNGTMVNGVRVKQHVLQHNDMIMLGHYHLRYVDEAASSRYPAARDASTFSPEQDKAASFSPAWQMQAQEASPGESAGRLYVISGPDFGKDILLDQAVIPLGSPELPVAIILQDGADYRIQRLTDDLSLTVNGRPLPVTEQGQLLLDHDLIAYDGVKMEFYRG